MADENPAKPFYSVLVLAFACSALVASAAVGLKPMQEANRILDRKKHILYAANLFDPAKSIEEMFTPIDTKVVELTTGDFVPESEIDPQSYKQLKAAFDSETGTALSNEDDIAKIRRVEKYSLVYLVKNNNKVEQVILPVRGKGLWSTMYAYVALDEDFSTIKGVSFYEHGETPGLGGEIENKQWQEEWRDKKIYKESGSVGLRFAKGKAGESQEQLTYEIDGLSGATLTTDGVDNLMQFWFGDHGFKSFIDKMQDKSKR